MNKLTKILFAPRPVARDAISARRVEEHIPALRRERLISVWTPDPETGRLICTWRRPAAESDSATANAGEPPPALQMAA